MNPTTILAATLGVNFVIVFIGIIAYLHNKKSATNFLFLTIAIITAIWAFVNYFSVQASTQDVLVWIRLVLFFAAPHSVAFLLFIHTFPSDSIQLPRVTFGITLVLLAIAMGGALSPYVFIGVETQGERIIPTPGPLMPLFALVTIGSVIGGIFLAIKKYLRSASFERIRWRFMLFGAITSYAALIVTNFLVVVVWKDTTFNALGALYMLPMIVGTGYAILQHRLLDIKVIATELLIFLVALIAFMNIWGYQDTIDLVFRLIIFLGLSIGGIFLIRSVMREVEQREQLEKLTKDLAVANKELKRLDAAKSEFVSIASHQLRTPLTAMKGYLSLLIEGTYGALPTKARKPLHSVYHSNQRLIHLVNDLLNMSRIESGKIKLEPKPTSITEVIQSVLGELNLKAEQKNLTLVFKEPAVPIPAIMVDQEKIRNAILNLIDNSIRYTNQGSITTSIAQKQNELSITIEDTGAGMTQEEISKLFESFSRGQAGQTLSTEGAGLGLYIAKQFVEMHKGRIWATSEGKGKGSTFRIELPMK